MDILMLKGSSEDKLWKWSSFPRRLFDIYFSVINLISFPCCCSSDLRFESFICLVLRVFTVERRLKIVVWRQLTWCNVFRKKRKFSTSFKDTSTEEQDLAAICNIAILFNYGKGKQSSMMISQSIQMLCDSCSLDILWCEFPSKQSLLSFCQKIRSIGITMQYNKCTVTQ